MRNISRGYTVPAGLVLSALIAAPASAGDYDAASQYPPGIEFELGAGGSVGPRYEGSSDFLFSPYPTVRLKRLTLPNGFHIGGGDGLGMSFYPSFKVRGERKASDEPELAGLPDVDTAVELGLGASYTIPNFSVFLEFRRGVTGHDGFVGELGADVIVRPNEAMTLSAGPRVSFADAKYMDTYFSVPAATATLPAFDAGAGFKSVGVETSVRYQFTRNVALEGSASYDRLIGDAGDSPIVGAGSRDQLGFRLGQVRSFRLDS